MTLEGVDYSYDRPDPAELVAAGKYFACRYLSNNPGKNLTRAEADTGAAAGLWWIVVWEEHGGGLTVPPAECAAESIRQAQALGIPAGRPIYAAVDWDAQPGEFGGIETFLRGFQAHLAPYIAGVYGSERVCCAMLDRGAVAWAWQTYAWSNGLLDPRAKVYQYRNNIELVGAQVDLDRAYFNDYGQWQPGRSPSEGGMAHSSWGSGYPNCQGSKINSSFSVSGTRFPGGIRHELVDLVTMLVQETKNRGYRFGTASDPSYGCWGYSCRAITGSSTPSNHSWGLAVDINAPSNPYTSPLITDMPAWMPDLWNEYGFRWGGDYSGSQDAMHYEFMGSVQDAANETAKARMDGIGGGSAATTPPKDWFDMATQADLEAAIRKCIPEIANAVLYFGLGGDKNDTVEKRLKNTLTDIKNGVGNAPKDVWGYSIKSQVDSKNYAAQSFLSSIDRKVED